MTATLDQTLIAPAPPATADDGGDTARTRLVISAVSLAAAVVGLFGQIAGVDALRLTGLGGYLLFGMGAAPWVLFRRIDVPLRLALSAGTSLAVLILGGTFMLESGLWYPGGAAALVFAATLPLHVFGVVLAVRERPVLGRPHVPPALGVAVLGAVLSLSAALTHRHLTPGVWGFLTGIGPFWYLGLALVVLALALARSASEAVLAAGVLLLMVVVTGTPSLVYDGPRMQAGAKHVELIEQIRALHELHSSVAVYNGWPGFFAGMAWLADVAGIRDTFHLAVAWPPLIGVFRIVAMRYLAGQLLAERWRVWLAVALGVLADTVGQDYFSPQSAGFVLALLVFGVALSTLRLGHKVAAMTVLGGASIVAHQLTPYAIGGALCVLVVFRQIRPWWLPATVLVPAVAWAGLHWSDLKGFVALSDLGRSANFRPPVTETTPGLHRLPVVAETSGALLLGILVVGTLALVTLIRRRRDRAAWALALCPSAGLAIIVVNPYGNEGIFRAALFGIPWLAILAAEAFRRPSPPVIATVAALTCTFVVATTGLDASNVIRPSDREAALRFEAANPGSQQVSFLLVLGPGDLPGSTPTQGRNHVGVKRTDLDSAGFTLNTGTPAATVQTLTKELVRYAGDGTPAGHLYAIWSPASSSYGTEYGIHTTAQFAGLRDAFVRSPSWTVVYDSGGTLLFQYTGRG